MTYPIPLEALKVLKKNPDISGAELARQTGLAGRSARRYVRKFQESVRMQTIVPKAAEPTEISLRAAVYDIEVTDFGTEGYRGVLLMCCILPLDTKEVETFELPFAANMEDQKLLEKVRVELGKYDILIGHNIAAFDSNWLNSRLIQYGLPPLRSHLYFDTYQVAKALALKTSKGLGNLMDYFGIKTAEKTAIYRSSWSNVYSRSEEVYNEIMSEIRYHCQQDVKGNYELFNRLYPYSIVVNRANPFKLSKSIMMSF